MPHVTEEVRAKILTIGVTVAEELPRVTVELPSKGAASGAGLTAGNWSGDWVTSAAAVLAVGARAGDGGVLLAMTAGAMLVVTPVVAAAGA